MRAYLAVILAVVGMACGPDPRDPEPPETLAGRMEQGVDLYAYEGGTLDITGRYTAGDIDRAGRATVGIAAANGLVQVDPDGVLWLETLEVALDDVDVELNTMTVRLTRMQLTLEERTGARARVTGFDLGAWELRVPVKLRLDWAMVGTNGHVAPLGAQHLGPLPMVVTLRLNPIGLVIARVELAAEGEVWNWAGLLHLEDPAVDFRMTDHPPAPPVD